MSSEKMFIHLKCFYMANLTKTPSRTRTNVDPWRDFLNLEDLFGSNLPPSRNSMPAVNVSEDEKSYEIEVAAPGFHKEDIHINIDDDVLTISGEIKREEKEGGNGRQYSRREYTYNAFTRSFTLPDDTNQDQISAHYENGILKMMIPKSKQQAKPQKEIRIN
jgi:HSP20 family protein